MNLSNHSNISFDYTDFCRAIGSDRIFQTAVDIYKNSITDAELEKPICTDLICRYFPCISHELLSAAEYINRDPLSLAYMNFLRIAYYRIPEEHIPYLAPEEGNNMKNFAPVFALLSYADKMESQMQKLCIDEITFQKACNVFERCLINFKNNIGYYAMPEYIFFWCKHYLAPDIFTVGTLEFEVTTFPDEGTVFSNIQNSNLVVLTDIEETEDKYCGYSVCRGGKSGKYTELSKLQYKLLLAPGDDVLSVHIPTGTKLDRKSCFDTYTKAIEFFNKTFPEKEFKALYCRSWLIDPELKQILPEHSNILSFQSFYESFPVKSTGQEIFTFVHPKPFSKYEDFPENTSLEKGLKQRYLNNQPIYAYAGIRLLNS